MRKRRGEIKPERCHFKEVSLLPLIPTLVFTSPPLPTAPLPVASNTISSCNGADLEAHSRVSFRVIGHWKCQLNAWHVKCWNETVLLLFFTPRLFDPPSQLRRRATLILTHFLPNSFFVWTLAPPQRDVSPCRHLQPFQKFTGQCNVGCVTAEAGKCPIISAQLAVAPRVNKTLTPDLH